MALFVVSTKDGWVDIMRRGIDARGVDLEVRKTKLKKSWIKVFKLTFILITLLSHRIFGQLSMVATID